MGRKKSKSNQSANTPVNNDDSSDSNDVNDKNASNVNCTHVARCVDSPQVAKVLKSSDNVKKKCYICERENKPVQGDDFYVCLKCGTKTCCKDHLEKHFSISRSEQHCIAYSVKLKQVWCHECSAVINERDSKFRKLSSCVDFLNSKNFEAGVINNKQNSKNNENKEKGNDGPSNTQNNAKKTGTHSKVDWSFNDESPHSLSGEKNTETVGKSGKGYFSSLLSTPVRGLTNLGNTCYFNSVMQCLARTQMLISELKEMDHTKDIRLELKGGEVLEGCLEKWDGMSECLYETITSLLTPGPAYAPTKFLNQVRKRHPQFEGSDQHDAHELLRHTLDTIKINDLKRYRRLMLIKKNVFDKRIENKEEYAETSKQIKELEYKVTQVQTFIPETTFKGRLVSRVECQECRHSSECIEGFLDLSLPVLADKPHPPAVRRKVGNTNFEEKLPPQSPKERRQEKKAARKAEKKLRKKSRGLDAGDQLDDVDEVVAEAEGAVPDKPEDTLGLDEDKRMESGYSSEKASSSLRGSPSSEEARSSSPCDDSWATIPHVTESWLNSLPEGVQLPTYPIRESSSFLVNRPPTHIPLNSDGTPNLAQLALHDSNGSVLNPLCQETSIIMEQEPDWRTRIYNSYFGVPQKTDEDNCVVKSSTDKETNSNETPAIMKSSSIENIEQSANVPTSTNDSRVEDVVDIDQSQADCNASNDSANMLCSDQTVPDMDDKTNSPSGQRKAAFSPYRRGRTAQLVKRDSGFSPVQEEDSDVLPETLPSIQEMCTVNSPTKTKEDMELRTFDEDGLPSEGIEDQKLDIGTIFNNNLDSDGNESTKDKSMNTISEEFPDQLKPNHLSSCMDTIINEFPLDENIGSVESNHLYDDSVVPSELSSKAVPFDTKCGSFLYEDETAKFSEEPSGKLNNSADEGDFEPLLSNDDGSKLPANPQENQPSTQTDFNELCNQLTSIAKKNENRDSSECSVESCLRQFTSIEVMTGSNKVGCSSCTERQNKGAKDGKTVLTMATKQLLIGQAPPVLILHLKRFQVQLHSFRKLSKHVSFPLILDLAPFCTSIGEDKNKVNNEIPMPYSLYGIVEHQGTLNSGHYVAYVKYEEDGKRRWFCISDSHVIEVTEERVLKSEAYLLFYSRISIPVSS